MKRIAVLAMAVLMIVCAIAPVSAATANGLFGDVPLYKGTITVDGKLDEIYKQGLVIPTQVYNEQYKSEATGTVYALHDGKNLYVAVAVHNVYPITEYNAKYDGTKSWNTTCVELYLDWSDKATDNKLGHKYYGRLDGKVVGASAVEGKEKEMGVTYGVVVDNAKNTYVAEFCVPMQNITTGANMGFNVCVNADANMGPDKNAKRTIAGITPGIGAAIASWKSVTLSNKEVKLAAATTAATTKAPSTKPASPATFDAGIVMAVVAAAAGAGVVVSKKRK